MEVESSSSSSTPPHPRRSLRPSKSPFRTLHPEAFSPQSENYDDLFTPVPKKSPSRPVTWTPSTSDSASSVPSPSSRPDSPTNTILLDEDSNATLAPSPSKRRRSRPKRKTAVPEDPLLLEYDSEVVGSLGHIPLCYSDISSLAPGEYINSRIIDFWLSHLHHIGGIHPRDQVRTSVFSSLFYGALLEHLKKTEGSEGGFSWASKVKDFFAKDFILIPIPLEYHWFLAVICFPGMVLQDEVKVEGTPVQKEDDTLTELRATIRTRKARAGTSRGSPEPMILVLDSLRSYGINHRECARNLRRFLDAEWENRYPEMPLYFTDTNLTLHVLDLPQQNNSSECGLFTLRFFEKFFITPLPRCSPFPKTLRCDWGQTSEEYYGLRELIYKRIIQLVTDIHEEEEVDYPKITFKKKRKYVEEEEKTQNIRKSNVDIKRIEIPLKRIEVKKVKDMVDLDMKQRQEDKDDSDATLDLEKAILRDWDISDSDEDYVPLVVELKNKK